MLKQLFEKAIPAFESSFPSCQGLFAFDNAKNHQKYALDGVHSGSMNLTPGGVNTLPMQMAGIPNQKTQTRSINRK